MPWLQGNAGINIWSVLYWVYSHFDHLFVNLHTLRCVIWSKMGEFQQASYIQYQCRKYLRHTPWTSVPVSSRSVSKGESVREEILSSHPEMDVCFISVHHGVHGKSSELATQWIQDYGPAKTSLWPDGGWLLGQPASVTLAQQSTSIGSQSRGYGRWSICMCFWSRCFFAALKEEMLHNVHLRDLWNTCV